MDLSKYFRKRPPKGSVGGPVPQTEPLPGMVANSAGGFGFAVDDWGRLDRFLVLGSEGGTYYVGERQLTRENVEAVARCIAADGRRVVARIVEISDDGRAPKTDPALFALAMAAGLGDAPTRAAALVALPRVARIGTHLFHFAQYVQAFRGWGRGLRRAVANWYLRGDVADIAFQAVKYGQRDGWSHRDLLRLAHPRTEEPARRALFHWIVDPDEADAIAEARAAHPLIDGALALREVASDPELAAEVIASRRIPREAVPTELQTDPRIWRALLRDLPATALLRSLGRLSAVGLLAPGDPSVAEVVRRLDDTAALARARVHPVAVLLALKVYAQGRGELGSLTWLPVPAIVDALDRAFYASFQSVQPTGKRLLLALDVSGSMGGARIAGAPLTAREGSVAMALVTLATERDVTVVAFQDRLLPLALSARQRLDDACRSVEGLPFGATDCAQPMLYALARGLSVDGFVVYTDSETWAGKVHPVEALRRYRERTGIPAKLVVVGMASNGFSIADPGDGGMLDVVGFDAAAPAVIADFLRG